MRNEASPERPKLASSRCDRVAKTGVGKMLGNPKKPLEAVLTIFWMNKLIQLGTFITWCARPSERGATSAEKHQKQKWPRFVFRDV
jgi:hypothetical protein|tara:strand:- start:14 stop:271 length:258 start_codon:yes stop_codon:yes gene_type:complete